MEAFSTVFHSEHCEAERQPQAAREVTLIDLSSLALSMIAPRSLQLTNNTVLNVLCNQAANSCEDPHVKEQIIERIPLFVRTMKEEGLFGRALLALSVDSIEDMGRLEVLLARARLPHVFVADFKLVLSQIQDLGGARASTSPTSTTELLF